MDRRICVDLGPASPFEGSWMTPGSDCLRVEPQCQLPTFHQSPVVLRPVANLISEGVVAFAHPLAYQGGERWGWSQISATTPYRQIDRAHRDWAQGQLGFIANVVRLYRGEHLDFTLGSDEAQAKIQGVFGKKPKFADVLGLCKAATVKEIEAQGWSLNPGRYVGVAPGEAVSDEDFKEQLEALNEELETLNSQAREFEEAIAASVAQILKS